jgi:hypothetical protein
MTGEQEGIASRSLLPWWSLAVVCGAWFALWFLTPGLLSNGIGHLFTKDPGTSILIETVIALVIAVTLVVFHRPYNRVLFERSWSVWLYLLPIALAAALPFHYELDLPVLLYMVWMTVSVFWQDYLTFGLLQSYLRERLPAVGAATISAVIFWLGHVLSIPERFGPTQMLASVAILTSGLVLASLRMWLKSLHLILVLHLSVYFVFA